MPPGRTTRAISATPLAGSGTKKNHQRHHGGIEAVLRKGKRHGVAFLESREARRRSCARKCELPWRRINRCHRGWRASFDNEFCERAVAAPDVDPAQPRRRRQPIEENVAGQPAPFSHHPFVSSSVVEADLRLGHQRPLIVSDPSYWQSKQPQTILAGLLRTGTPPPGDRRERRRRGCPRAQRLTCTARLVELPHSPVRPCRAGAARKTAAPARRQET
jgi:hypothetical protein